MAAVTQDISMRIIGTPRTHKFVMDSSIAQTWYKGEPLIVDASADATNVTPVHDVTHPHIVNADAFVGIAAEGGSFAISTAESLEKTGVEAYIDGTIIGLKSTVYTDGAHIGATLYWESGALSLEGTDTCPVGRMLFAEDGYIYFVVVTASCTGADS
jgi:hypothetical protein